MRRIPPLCGALVRDVHALASIEGGQAIMTNERSMRLFLIGATGRIGRAVIDQAIERGDTITAFVRSPGKLGDQRAWVSVQKGDPRNVDELRAALPGHDAVISALGPPGLGRTTIHRDAARSTIAAMQAVGVRRLLIVSAAVLFDDERFLYWLARNTFLRNVAEDHAAMERIVTASELDWTIVRPPRLTMGSLTARYAVEDGRMPPGRQSISRADVAHFLLDEVEHAAHLRRAVGITSTKAPAPQLSAGPAHGGVGMEEARQVS
jgi:putative NADH-flavin reductase